MLLLLLGGALAVVHLLRHLLGHLLKLLLGLLVPLGGLLHCGGHLLGLRLGCAHLHELLRDFFSDLRIIGGFGKLLREGGGLGDHLLLIGIFHFAELIDRLGNVGHRGVEIAGFQFVLGLADWSGVILGGCDPRHLVLLFH